MALVQRDEYHLTIMDDSGLLVVWLTNSKMSGRYELTWPEFKRDPFGFHETNLCWLWPDVPEVSRQTERAACDGRCVSGDAGLVGAVMLMDRYAIDRHHAVGLILFALIAGGLLVALFSTWLGARAWRRCDGR